MEYQEDFYARIGQVYCPYFRESVYFTRTGFEHLKLKHKYKARTEKDRAMRFRLLPIALKLLSSSYTLQGKIARNNFEYRYINNRKEIALVLVTYYEFMAIIDGKKIKVIIKQIENNERIFLSVIPLFKQKMPPVRDDIL